MWCAAQVVMFHQYPQELLRGWLRQHNIRDDQVDFWVLPPTPGTRVANLR